MSINVARSVVAIIKKYLPMCAIIRMNSHDNSTYTRALPSEVSAHLLNNLRKFVFISHAYTYIVVHRTRQSAHTKKNAKDKAT